MIRQPIFLVGAERSGTTLLRLMLDHHPRIAFGAEFEFAVDQLVNDDWPPLEPYHEYLQHNRVFLLHSLFPIDRTLGYPQLVDSFLQQLRERVGKPIVGATVHVDFDRLTRIWPDARFIYILRDGRDVARSVVEMGWAGNAWVAAEGWAVAEQTWKRVRNQVGPERRIEIRYEDLIGDSRSELERLCDFADVKYAEAMLDYVEDSTYDKPDERLVVQWKRKMSPRSIQLVEARIGDMLVERGYELSGLPRIEIKQRWMILQSRVAGIRFRFKRYGLRLAAADLLARRLGLTRWQSRLRLKLNEIDNQFLK